MVSFFQKYRILFILVACGLSLFGLIFSEMKSSPAPLVLLTIPGIILGVFMFLINPQRKHSPKLISEADELLKWNQLKESGAISEAEYEIKKKEILG